MKSAISHASYNYDANHPPIYLNLLLYSLQYRSHMYVPHCVLERERDALYIILSTTEVIFSFSSRFDDVNQRGHIVGSWLEDGSWGLGVFAPDTSKFRVLSALVFAMQFMYYLITGCRCCMC